MAVWIPRITVDKDILTPETVGQVLPRHQLVSTLQQQQEQVHGLAPQSQATPLATQLVRGGVELEVSEAEDHVGNRCTHARTRQA